MRDPSRIPRLINFLTGVRVLYPELDLWTFTSEFFGRDNVVLKVRDPFYTEDTELEKLVTQYMEDHPVDYENLASVERMEEIRAEMDDLKTEWMLVPDQRFGQLVYNNFWR
jgi:hypothetical protein